jgi:hypothetical protein
MNEIFETIFLKWLALMAIILYIIVEPILIGLPIFVAINNSLWWLLLYIVFLPMIIGIAFILIPKMVEVLKCT